MAFDASKTILLEKQYLYIKASKGFQLEGTNIERVWVNTGYYRFLVDNVAKALSNSYVKVLYDSSDIDFIAYCSDLFLEEIQNTVVVAIENLQSYVEQFYDRNHEDISELSEGLSGSLQYISETISEPNVVLNQNGGQGEWVNCESFTKSFSFYLYFSWSASGSDLGLRFYKCPTTNCFVVCPDGTLIKMNNSTNIVDRMAGLYRWVYAE